MQAYVYVCLCIYVHDVYCTTAHLCVGHIWVDPSQFGVSNLLQLAELINLTAEYLEAKKCGVAVVVVGGRACGSACVCVAGKTGEELVISEQGNRA